MSVCPVTFTAEEAVWNTWLESAKGLQGLEMQQLRAKAGAFAHCPLPVPALGWDVPALGCPCSGRFVDAALGACSSSSCAWQEEGSCVPA